MNPKVINCELMRVIIKSQTLVICEKCTKFKHENESKFYHRMWIFVS